MRVDVATIPTVPAKYESEADFRGVWAQAEHWMARYQRRGLEATAVTFGSLDDPSRVCFFRLWDTKRCVAVDQGRPYMKMLAPHCVAILIWKKRAWRAVWV